MKRMKGFALGLVAGLAVAIGTVGVAQSTKLADKSQKVESCSTMSCCCQGDSCALHSGQQHATGQMKHGDGQMKTHSNEGGCCCCGGDSCDMQMKAKEEAKQKQ